MERTLRRFVRNWEHNVELVSNLVESLVGVPSDSQTISSATTEAEVAAAAAAPTTTTTATTTTTLEANEQQFDDEQPQQTADETGDDNIVTVTNPRLKQITTSIGTIQDPCCIPEEPRSSSSSSSLLPGRIQHGTPSSECQDNRVRKVLSEIECQKMAPPIEDDLSNLHNEMVGAHIDSNKLHTDMVSAQQLHVQQTISATTILSASGSSGAASARRRGRGNQSGSSNQLSNDEASADEDDALRACDVAAQRLRELAIHLEHGSVPTAVLHKTLEYAASVLESVKMDAIRRQLDEDEDDLSEVQSEAVPIEVRKWLETTFTRNSISQKRQSDDKLKFRSVANAIRAGIVVDKIYRRMSGTSPLVSPEVANLLKQIDDWSFDCFSVNQLSNGQVLKSVAYELFNRYGLLYKFKIPTTTMRNFLTQVEAGYVKHKNPYHNNLHAADVTQTVHYMLLQGLANWLTDLEIFATLFAAIVHDYLHTGTTNNFHVMSRSETALVYNDRSVLENFHVSAAFRLLLEDDCNILANLSNDDYREFRSLVIDMVLATDMSSHFQQIKAMKTILNHSEFNADKSKVLSLVIHVSDISHPAKKWELHSHWTQLLMKEFFRQGDKEKQLNLECSPLCDRDTTLVAESQLGFIEFIVNPSMEVCGDVLDRVQLLILGSRACTSPLAIGSTGSGAPCTASGPATTSPGVVQASSSSYQTTKPPRRIASLPPSTNSTRSNSSTRQFSVAATSTNPFEDNQPQQYGEPQHAQDKASAASGTTCATNSIKYDIKPAFQHPVIKFQQSDFKSLAPDPPPRSLQPHTKSASGQLSADGDSRETRVISSAPATPVPSSQVVAQYKIKRPWIECLERNKRMWQERAVLGLDAMI